MAPGTLLSACIACDGGPKGLPYLDRPRDRAEESVWRRWTDRFFELLNSPGFPNDRSDAGIEAFHATTAAPLTDRPVGDMWLPRPMGVEIERFLRLVGALPEFDHQESDRYSTFRVRGRPFGYLWPRTATVGLKQTLLEQTALVAERPEVFEVQFTAGGFGWVVVQHDGIDLDELSELTLEAWYLTAPDELLTAPPTPASLVQA